MIGIVVGLVLQIAASQAHEENLVRDARSAQSRFESVRRMNLVREPRDFGHPCHARVGRYCFWSDGEETTPPVEPGAIVRARQRLLAVLDTVLSRIPTNAWVHGQITRYLVEAGRAADAAERARTCAAERWWCAALEGLALHVSERYGEADSVYSIALDSMPLKKRCEWIDLRLLVNSRLSREIERASCAEREAIATRLWTLAKPMWTTTGNDVRTEHFARWTMAEIQAESAIGHTMRFGKDSRELMLRYGWSEWFTREEPSPGSSTMSSPSITGHGREPSHSFFPNVGSMRGWPRLTVESWRFRDTLAPSLYAPRHLKRVTKLAHQLARIRRGDSLEIAVAYDVDSILMQDAVSADVSLLHANEIKRRVTNRRIGNTSRGSLRLTVPPETLIVSIEVRGDSSKRLSRARFTVDPLVCTRVCVSDLVLFSGHARSDNGDLDFALSNALTKMRHSVQEPLGVYWEVSGTASNVDMDVSLLVTPVKVSRVRRMAVALRLAPEQSPVALRWRASPRRFESVTLRLPSGARGTYRVVLTVDPSNGSAVTSTREIELDR